MRLLHAKIEVLFSLSDGVLNFGVQPEMKAFRFIFILTVFVFTVLGSKVLIFSFWRRAWDS
jgi:hypothetical protein